MKQLGDYLCNWKCKKIRVFMLIFSMKIISLGLLVHHQNSSKCIYEARSPFLGNKVASKQVYRYANCSLPRGEAVSFGGLFICNNNTILTCYIIS